MFVTIQTGHWRRALLAIWAALALTISACGGSGGEQAGGKDGAANKSVTWWGWAPGKALADTYLAEFKKVHPDIKVTYKEIPYDGYVNALRLGLQAESGPDVYNLQPGEITKRFGPLAVDLTSRVTESRGEDWQSSLVGASHTQFAVEGKQYGMPVQLSASGIYWYNKTLLDKHGLKPPKSAAELSKACETLSRSGITCMAQGAKDAWANIDVYMTLAADLAPGLFYEAVEGKKPWTEAGLVEAFKLWKQLFDDGVFGKGSSALAVYPDTVAQFSTGKAAMIVLGTWQAGFMDAKSLAMSQKKATPYVILPSRFPDMNGDGSQPATFGSPDYGLAVSKKSDAQDAAWTFVDWLSGTPEGQNLIAGEKFVPAMKGVPLGTKGLVSPELGKPALEQMVEFYDGSKGYREIPYAEIKTALGDALAAVAVGQQSPEDAAKSIEQVSGQVDRG